MIPALLATIAFALSITCGHRSARLLGGAEANFWRLVLATVLLGLWAFVFGEGMHGSAFFLFVISGVIGIGIGDSALFQAFPRLGSRLTALVLQCLSVIFAGVIEWGWLGTRLSVAEMICDGLILAGVGVALTPLEHLRRERSELLLGLSYCTLAAFGNGFGMVISRKAFASQGGQAIDGGTAAFQRLTGGLLFTALVLLVVRRKHMTAWVVGGKSHESPSLERWRKAAIWVAANGFFGMTLGVSCLLWALKSTPTATVQTIVALTPLAVIPLARVMENERVPPRSLAGALVAVAGTIALLFVR